MWTKPDLSTVPFEWFSFDFGRWKACSRVQFLTKPTNQALHLSRILITLCHANELKQIVTQEVKGRHFVQMKESRAAVPESYFTARCEISFQGRQDFGWQRQETRFDIVEDCSLRPSRVDGGRFLQRRTLCEFGIRSKGQFRDKLFVRWS